MDRPSGPARVKKCSRCEAALVCGPVDGKAGCWCEELPNILPFTGEDCLCKECAVLEIENLEKARREGKGLTPGRAAVLWTGGKDCALALHEARRSGLPVEELVTFAPPSPVFLAHPLPFLKRQAAAMGLRHRVVTIRPPAEDGYTQAVKALQSEGIRTLVTGDIAEVGGRPNWMREVSRGTGLEVLTPLWGRDRRGLLSDLLDGGFKAVFSLVKKPWFTREWVGRAIDRRAVEELASLVPCPDLSGENGEYHTLVLDGPIFKNALSLAAFEVGEKDGMMYMEIK